MKRRKFFGNLGIGITAAVIAPAKLLAENNTQSTYKSYFTYDGETRAAILRNGWYESHHKLENGMIYTDISIYIEAKEFHMNDAQTVKYPFPILAVSKDWNRPEKAWLEIQVNDITPEYMELAKTGAPNVYNLIKWNEENL